MATRPTTCNPFNGTACAEAWATRDGSCEHSRAYLEDFENERAADRAADELDRWADGRVEPEYQTGADEIVYADERDNT
jgi:hypothetical protein